MTINSCVLFVLKIFNHTLFNHTWPLTPACPLFYKSSITHDYELQYALCFQIFNHTWLWTLVYSLFYRSSMLFALQNTDLQCSLLYRSSTTHNYELQYALCSTDLQCSLFYKSSTTYDYELQYALCFADLQSHMTMNSSMLFVLQTFNHTWPLTPLCSLFYRSSVTHNY